MQIFKGIRAGVLLATLLATSVLASPHPNQGQKQKPIARKEW